MEKLFEEIEDEVHLDIEDKEDESISDEEKRLKYVLKRIGESAALRAKMAHKLDEEYRRENQ